MSKPDEPNDRDEEQDAELAPVALEITDVLDLHTFAPRDVRDLVSTYVDECIARGFSQVRIIHGKGTGTLRRIVHSALANHPGVERYELADQSAGSWGATVAWLRLP